MQIISLTKKIIITLALISLCLLLNFKSYASEKKLENKYINDLKSWIKNGSRNSNDIRMLVLAPCSKLVMLMATPKERQDFISRSKIDEYDFRAGFCMSAVINNVWPNQPGFTKKFQKSVCREKIPLIRRVCKEFI
jgi:hypothetical protein